MHVLPIQRGKDQLNKLSNYFLRLAAAKIIFELQRSEKITVRCSRSPSFMHCFHDRLPHVIDMRSKVNLHVANVRLIPWEHLSAEAIPPGGLLSLGVTLIF